MALVVFVLVVATIGVIVWRKRTREGPTKPGGLVADLVDQGRDLMAPLFPAKPMSRRALPKRLLRAAEQTVTIGVSGTVLVPTRIRISVNPEDLEPFTEALEWLRRDVAEALRAKAQASGWVVPDGPEVTIVADPDRPVRMPRAVGKLDAFRPEHVRTPVRPETALPPPPRPGPGPGPAPAPDRPDARAGASAGVGAGTEADADATGRTSLVVGDAGTVPADGQATVPVEVSVHLRLVFEGKQHTGGDRDLNALLTASADPMVLGRSREAPLRVGDRQVSGRHCAFSVALPDLTVRVQDLGSTNGTWVDGERIDEAALTDGATLKAGESTWRVALDPVTS
jgi:hypothetical protein